MKNQELFAQVICHNHPQDVFMAMDMANFNTKTDIEGVKVLTTKKKKLIVKKGVDGNKKSHIEETEHKRVMFNLGGFEDSVDYEERDKYMMVYWPNMHRIFPVIKEKFFMNYDEVVPEDDLPPEEPPKDKKKKK